MYIFETINWFGVFMEDGYHEVDYPNGDRYKGEYKYDNKHGQGVYTFADGERYEGEWKYDNKHGQGVYTYSDGERYEGEFKDDNKHGQGVYTFADGERYEGEFKDDNKNGQGVYTYSDGERYEGEFKDGKRNGQGIIYKYDILLKDSSGKYVEDKFVEGLSDKFNHIDYFENLAENVLSSKNKIFQRRKLRNSFTSEITKAIEESSYSPTRLKQLQEIVDILDEEMNNNKSTDQIKNDNNSNLNELAKITGRSFEDIKADLADDGILNYSAGSDAKIMKNDGQINLDRYRKLHHLQADGGMAEVHTAIDKETGDVVIWKEAATKHHSAKVSNKALLNEIEILKQLDHPRIPNHIDSGTIKNNDGQTVQVLIMEKIEGDSLDKEMKIFTRRKIKQSLDEVTKIISEICEPLEYMADLNPPVYHRDIKPHNIMLNHGNGVSLIDFGLAKGVDAGVGLSLSGGIHTAGWGPPERENGDTGSYTDVYSLGQLLWHMLTNERAGIHSEDKRITTIEECGHPRWVADLINKAVVPDDPKKRIQSVFEFRIRLENEDNYQE